MVAFTKKKKRGQNASFFLNPIPWTARKMVDQIAWKKFIKSPELPKTIEKLESSADHDSCGLSSNVCTDHGFFHEEVLF